MVRWFYSNVTAVFQGLNGSQGNSFPEVFQMEPEDEVESCEMLSPGHDKAIARFSPQQLWLPALDQASQYSNMVWQEALQASTPSWGGIDCG